MAQYKGAQHPLMSHCLLTPLLLHPWHRKNTLDQQRLGGHNETVKQADCALNVRGSRCISTWQ
jgi:hypothetical protein